MIGLLKTFGKGFLYVLGLPFFLVALALFGVLGLCAFIFQLIKSVIFFFTGHKFFPELKEDKELRLLKEGSNHPQEDVNSQPVSPSNDIITPAFWQEFLSILSLPNSRNSLFQNVPATLRQSQKRGFQ